MRRPMGRDFVKATLFCLLFMYVFIASVAILDSTLKDCDQADNTSEPSDHWYGIGENNFSLADQSTGQGYLA